MTERIYLQAYTRAERHLIIEELREAIAAAGGWIVDFQLFSNLALSITIEIDPAGPARLVESLERLDLQLSAESRATALTRSEAPNKKSEGREILVLLNLTFRQGDGELRLPIPPIPG
ncbi:MAG: hypothetical protein ACOYLF_09785 [Blastocatellia bacterium]|jgi:hypothetical protein